ncbi:MAG: acyl-ACP desaturase [Actinomycetota bacterium]
MPGREPNNPELLRELQPVVARGLNRHISTFSEWQPHEFVPYEEGRNYVKEPWQPSDSRLPDIAQISLEVNLLTEDNLPYYHLAIWDTFGHEEAWGEWVRRWTAEEGRHAIVLRDYLVVTRGIDPAVLEQGRMDMVQRGWYPEFAEIGPLDGVVFTSIQELATRISHRNTGLLTEDETAIRLTQRVATDENFHYVFYRDLAAAALQMAPSDMMLAIRRQVRNFAMPGEDMPGFADKAKAMARAGVYNLRIHHDQVLRPILFKHWKIDQLTGLTDEAKQARDDIVAHMARIDRIATKLGHPTGPSAASGEPQD